MEAKNTASDQLKKLDSVLDEYERSLGVPKFNDEFHDDSAKRYMALSRAEIEKLTPSECAEAALLLGSLSFHMQRAYNREVARVNWAKQTLRSTVAGREQSYRGSWESQFNQAVDEDGYARKVMQIQKYAQQRADRLTYLASSIKNISEIFLAVQRTKVMKHG
jgi:hypothetical protein|tara:strand:- start:66 stop:554 length:489 start_codon:yes stop_codon:yes gene_type:complete